MKTGVVFFCDLFPKLQICELEKKKKGDGNDKIDKIKCEPPHRLLQATHITLICYETAVN